VTINNAIPCEPSVDHAATNHLTEIDGVVLRSLPSVNYEYGVLSELHHADWDTFYDEPIEHMYVISNGPNSRSDWHVHYKTVDRYVLLNGAIDIALFDNREDSETHNSLILVTLNAVGNSGFHALKIPVGVWHTFKSDVGFTLLNNKYPKYDRHDPDKYVMPLSNDRVDFHW
jgi:dTDP-4-dehydrorhamnose 3,5-epimerase-like enzyme